MANVVGGVAIAVTADIGPLIRETNRAKGVMSGFDRATQRMGGGLNRVGAGVVAFGSKVGLLTAGIGALAGVALAFTSNAAAMGDAIGDGAKAAGLSTTAFQEYRFALKEAADMTDDEFASAMQKLNKSLGEAREGSLTAIRAFEKIGISQADIASGSVDTEDALAAFVTKMESLEDPAIAAALATDLFGKSGAGLGAALSGVPGQVGALVARARELGVVLGPDAVKAAGEFDQKMKELGAQLEATKIKLANVLLPVMVNEFLPFLTDTLVPGIQTTIDKIAEWGTAIGSVVVPLEAMIAEFSAKFGEIAPMVSALFEGPGAPLAMLGAAITVIGPKWAEISTAASSAFTAIGGFIDAEIERLGRMLTKIGEVAAGLARLFQASPEATGAVNDSMRQNAIDLGYIQPDGGRDRQGNTGRPPNGGSNSSTGASLIDGMVDGMNLTLQERLPEIQAAAQLVTDTFRAQLGVQSPSTVFTEIGQFVGQGLANGIASTQGIVSSAVGVLGDSAVQSSDAMVDGVLAGLDTLFAGSKQVGAGIALINTMIGASEEIKKGTFGFASAARVIAQGMTFVKAIKGAKKSGEGGAGARGGGGGAAAAQQPTTTMQFTFQNDPFGFSESFARQMVAQLNKAQQSGSRIIGVVG